jgi:hypothetical protein
MNLSVKSLLAPLLIAFTCSLCMGQLPCLQPNLPSFKQRTTDGITIDWRDNNSGVVTWEIELTLRDVPITGNPQHTEIGERTFRLEGLESGTAYDVYLRTRCSETVTSPWNGPFSFHTVLTNPSSCLMDLPLRDDNCQIGFDNFLIDVQSSGLMGQNIFLESVDIIIEHDWPADLHLVLQSPSGKTVSLSRFNGTFTDDYGLIEEDCGHPANFSSEACESIRDGRPPFLGSFKPEESLNIFNDATQAKGIWTLRICDNAPNDKGVLKYAKLNFSNRVCLPIENFGVENVRSNGVDVFWVPNSFCSFLTIEYGPQGFTPGTGTTITVNCQTGSHSISGLLPEESYDLVLITDCISSRSSPTCPWSFTTNCATPTMTEGFDAAEVCLASCAVHCNISTSIWGNNRYNETDWIVWSGPTDTDKTGPEQDVSGGGNYLYIENNVNLCGGMRMATLESSCIAIGSIGACDMSFYYHMNGLDIGDLKLEISSDDGQNWDELFYQEGEQSDEWIREIVSLQDYKEAAALFRFTATGGDGDMGDIALDQIDFFGSQSIGEGYVYYKDEDGDGYGVDHDSVIVCLSVPPSGYASLKGDCDDTDPMVNPGMEEIPCNGIDDNCDGFINDFDISIDVVDITAASCEGIADGRIFLELSGGTPPYQIVWSNGMTGNQLSDLKSGFYRASITDINGCLATTGFYQVSAQSQINLFINNVVKASCNGVSDGAIHIQHTGGIEPFKYEWSNGSSSKNLENVTSGTYHLSITDAAGCRIEHQNIVIGSQNSLQVGTSFKRNVSCHGQSNGIIEVNTLGGTPPYIYNWEDGVQTNRREGLPAGLYHITATDAQGCMQDFSTLILQPDSLETIITNIEDVRCAGERNGRIRTLTAGGTTPYNFLWSNNSTNPNLSQIGAGVYTLTVTDFRGCRATTEVVSISEPTSLEVDLTGIVAASCRERSDGSLLLNVQGGTPFYQYSWRNTQSDTAAANNIFSGFYAVTVFDLNGCKVTLNNLFVPFLNTPFPIEASIDKDVLCPNGQNGQVLVSIENERLPVDYNWSSGVQRVLNATADTLRNVGSGSYNVTVTDSDGCFSISNAILMSNYPNFNFRIDSLINLSCFGDENGAIFMTVNGGTKPYRYLWNTGQESEFIRDLPAGKYRLEVFDLNDCRFQTPEIHINEPPPLTFREETSPARPDLAEGTIRIFPEGGVSPYKIYWEDVIGEQQFVRANLLPQSYYFTLVDHNLCELDSFSMVDLLSSLSKDENPNSDISLFPNPCTDAVFVKLDRSGFLGKIALELYSYNGVLIDRSPINVHEIENGVMYLNVSHLTPGIYILSVTDGHKRNVVQFIKQ